eukprot:COSAG04_NODE_1515_length_6480_cov_5.513086_4_plen_60_part_00
MGFTLYSERHSAAEGHDQLVICQVNSNTSYMGYRNYDIVTMDEACSILNYLCGDAAASL